MKNDDDEIIQLCFNVSMTPEKRRRLLSKDRAENMYSAYLFCWYVLKINKIDLNLIQVLFGDLFPEKLATLYSKCYLDLNYFFRTFSCNQVHVPRLLLSCFYKRVTGLFNSVDVCSFQYFAFERTYLLYERSYLFPA